MYHGPRVSNDPVTQSLFAALVGSEEVTHLPADAAAVLQSPWGDDKNGARWTPAWSGVIAFGKASNHSALRCSIPRPTCTLSISLFGVQELDLSWTLTVSHHLFGSPSYAAAALTLREALLLAGVSGMTFLIT